MILAWLAAAWCAGAACAALFGEGAYPIALALVSAPLAAAAWRRQARLAFYALALPALFTVSVARYQASGPHVASDAVGHYNDGVEMRMRGVLRDDPDVADTSQLFAIDARHVQVRGEWLPASGGVQVRTGLLPRYRSGDVLELEGKLESPPALKGFDYAGYLARRGIGSVMAYPSARTIGHEDDDVVRATILHVRRGLSRALALSLPEPQASLAQGVLLGQRSALPRGLADDLNATNTSHLVVVSGENVVLVSAYVALALSWVVGRRRALVLSILAVVAYATLIGLSPPVLRALIMGILMVVATIAGRRSAALSALLFAAALMIALQPQTIRDVSFQLSFAATAGIMFLASPLRRWSIVAVARALRLETVPRWAGTFLAEPLAVTLSAIFATAPLLALNFGRVSLVAVPANLLVVPLFPLILASSLVAALGGLLPAFRLVFAAPAYYLLTYWIEVTRWLAALPHAAASVGGYGAFWAAVTYAALGSLALMFLRQMRVGIESPLAESRPLNWARLRAVAVLALPAAAIASGAALAFWPSSPERLEVTFLDVGQGDAILLRTPSGHDVLVDGGPGRAVLRGLGDELPWHDRDIELLVLTHPQADHALGLLDVLARYDVTRIVAGPGAEPSATYRAWLESVAGEGTPLQTAREGDAFDLGDGVRIDVLAPDATMAADARINNTGAVLRVSWRDISFLLTGDIEAAAERAMLSDGVELRANVLKVAHHGSATSSTRAFLDAVQPQIAVVMSGADNPFGLPAPEVVSRIQEYADVYNTATDGAVHVETDGHRLWVSTSR